MRQISGGALAAALLLAACGNGGSAVETRDREGAPAAAPLALSEQAAPQIAQVQTPPEAPAQAAVVLTSNRRETAGAKAVRLYERNGADFGATSAEDYLEKAKAFTKTPPADAEKVSRPNGDVLIYQARTNTFAVVDRRGVVRTMFKPSNGAEYWERQKATAASFGR
ncbi:S-type pyocin family protein [uncultured Brevundimonas sp.]|uniref:S-type pyocin family protein n=1 Tax=uncultured Brevundimonas sp. TaxID=213418 RepID=UPI00261E082D|nr:S-type pyocin family protein [uncultured Brevundimonas sp.]